MKTNSISSTKIMTSGWLSCLFMAIMALVIFASPNAALSTDRLMVTDTTGSNDMFVAGDSVPLIRLNTNNVPASAQNWWLMFGANTNNIAGLDLDSYGSAATYGGGADFRFARGSQAAPTAVETGDRLGFFVFSGYDGANWYNSAGLTAKVDNTVSTGTVPTKLIFETLAQPGEIADDGVRVERMAISSKGYVAIGGSGSLGTGIPTPSYPFQLGNGAYVTAGGVWTNASSRAYKENIIDLTTEKANETLDGLNPVEYNYKVDKGDKHVGFIAEDVPDLVATKDRKGLSPMDIVAVLTKVVQEQKNTISEQTNMISDLAKRLDAMQYEINRVKAMNVVGSIDQSIK